MEVGEHDARWPEIFTGEEEVGRTEVTPGEEEAGRQEVVPGKDEVGRLLEVGSLARRGPDSYHRRKEGQPA